MNFVYEIPMLNDYLCEISRGPPGPSSNPFLLGASGRQRQNERMGDELLSPCSKISAACCELSDIILWLGWGFLPFLAPAGILHHDHYPQCKRRQISLRMSGHDQSG